MLRFRSLHLDFDSENRSLLDISFQEQYFELWVSRFWSYLKLLVKNMLVSQVDEAMLRLKETGLEKSPPFRSLPSLNSWTDF